MSDCALDKSHRAGAPIAILGVPFDNLTVSQTVAMVERMIASRRPHYLVTANVDFLVQAREDVELRRILLDAHLVLCDGTPLVWASRLLGNPLAERVAGADLVPLLIRIAAEKKLRLFFLGGAPDAIGQATARLKKKFPELIIAGNYSPPFQQLLEMDHEEISRQIKEARPDLLFVSFGCPKQEKWIAMHYRSLGVPVSVGVGATIDFLAGRVKRAPVWMQRSGTEWIFRLAQEPRRLFRRYSKDLCVFSWNIAAQWLQFQNFRKDKNGHETFRFDDKWMTMPARLDCETVQNNSTLTKNLNGEGSGLLDMSRVKFIDSTGVGFLIQLQKRVRAGGRELVLVAPSEATRSALELMKLTDFFAVASDLPAARRLIESRGRETANCTQSVDFTEKLFWQGEITAANAEHVWQRTQLHLTRNSGTTEPVLIDLTAVRFMDSSGLGVMVRAKKMARQQGVSVTFTGIQPAVQNVIHFARLESFLLN